MTTTIMGLPSPIMIIYRPLEISLVMKPSRLLPLLLASANKVSENPTERTAVNELKENPIRRDLEA